jgi:amino acid transporter
MVIFYGYASFRPAWNVTTFFQNYTMQILDPILFIGWKLIKKTKMKSVYEIDLVWERPTIEYVLPLLDPLS